MASVQDIENDYIAAKKKNNRIKMKVTSKLVTEIKILAARKGLSPIPQNLIDAAVIRQLREKKAEILACPKAKTKTLDNLYKELNYIRNYVPPVITNKEAIKQGIIQLADKYNLLIDEDNKSELSIKIVEILGERIDMDVATEALEELINEGE